MKTMYVLTLESDDANPEVLGCAETYEVAAETMEEELRYLEWHVEDHFMEDVATDRWECAEGVAKVTCVVVFT